MDNNTNPIDAFLQRHENEIAETYRAWIREAAAKAIKGSDINLNHCPAHLRSELLNLIIDEAEKRRKKTEAEYLSRNAGRKFQTGKNALWI